MALGKRREIQAIVNVSKNIKEKCLEFDVTALETPPTRVSSGYRVNKRHSLDQRKQAESSNMGRWAKSLQASPILSEPIRFMLLPIVKTRFRLPGFADMKKGLKLFE